MFKDKVLTVVAKIPKGRVLTYKEAAKLAGRPRAYRAVGNILSKNHDHKIPCHRVVCSDGKIGGYNRGVKKKIALLRRERLCIKKLLRKHTLILDVGTTGIKAAVFDYSLNLLARAYEPLTKSYPQKAWVEQNPWEIVKASQKALRQAIKKSDGGPSAFVGLGITNQRETTILWNKKTGRPVYPAIVWEDARTKKYCQSLSKFEKLVRNKTGLKIDSYFSVSKIRWILEQVKEAPRLLRQGDLLFGTVDTWVLWNFIGRHLTDYTNASRTLLFNIKTKKWDRGLIKIFFPEYKMSDILKILPRVQLSQSYFGKLKKNILGFSWPVLAVCGDQQASLYAAMKEAATKVTYGTGAFVMQVLGKKFCLQESFFTTLAPDTKKPLYALEAKVENTGQQVARVINQPAKLRKTLTKIAQQVDFYLSKLPLKPKKIIIDGGISQNALLAEIQSRISKIPVVQQKIYDGTALGTARLCQLARSCPLHEGGDNHPLPPPFGKLRAGSS